MNPAGNSRAATGGIFSVIDPKGGIHSLARRIEGAKVKDVRARMADVDMKRLPSVAEARKAQYARHGSRSPSRNRSVAARRRVRLACRPADRSRHRQRRSAGGRRSTRRDTVDGRNPDRRG